MTKPQNELQKKMKAAVDMVKAPDVDIAMVHYDRKSKNVQYATTYSNDVQMVMGFLAAAQHMLAHGEFINSVFEPIAIQLLADIASAQEKIRFGMKTIPIFNMFADSRDADGNFDLERAREHLENLEKLDDDVD